MKIKLTNFRLNLKVLREVEKALFLLTIFSLPVQLGKHFWPDFAFVDGIRVDYLSPTLYLTDILIIVLFSFWFCKGLRKYGFRIRNKTLISNSLFIILFLWIIITSVISKQPLASFYGFLKILEFTFLAFYTAKEISKFGIGKIIKTLSLSAFIFSIIGIIQFVKQGSIGGIFYYLGERNFSSSTIGIANMNVGGELILRPYSTFAHPNIFAFYLLFVNVLVMFQIFVTKETNKKALLIISLIISSIALFLTFSRIIIFIYLGFLIYLFVYLSAKKMVRLYFLRKTLNSLKLLKFSFLKKLSFEKAVFLFVFLFFLFYFSQFYLRFLDLNLLLRDFSLRQELISISLDIFKQNPIFGIGLKNFFYYESIYQKTISPMFFQPVHNVFILVLVETGIIGLILFCFLLLKSFKNLRRNIKFSKNLEVKNFYKAVMFCFISLLIVSLFDHFFLTLHQGLFILALIFGFVYAKL